MAKKKQRCSATDVLNYLMFSDSSEAHAIEECIRCALEDEPEAEHEQTTINMLEEFNSWSTAMLKLLRGKTTK